MINGCWSFHRLPLGEIYSDLFVVGVASAERILGSQDEVETNTKGMTHTIFVIRVLHSGHFASLLLSGNNFFAHH